MQIDLNYLSIRQLDFDPANMTFCSLQMDQETVNCFGRGAKADDDILKCRCQPSCHETNFKVS